MEDEATICHRVKRQKRWVTPEQREDISSIGSIEEKVTETRNDDEAHLRRLTRSVEILSLHVLSLLQEKETESLIFQSGVRSRLAAPRNLSSCKQDSLIQDLQDEKLKCGISTVMLLFLQSPSILGKSLHERKETLVRFQSFINEDWDDTAELFLAKFRNLLRRSLIRPPRVVCLAGPISTPSRAYQPKQLRFDTAQRYDRLMTRSRSVLIGMKSATQALLKQRLESPCDDAINAKLLALEGESDVMQLWSDLIERQSAPSEEALDLFEETLHHPDPLDAVLWNFVFFVSLSHVFEE